LAGGGACGQCVAARAASPSLGGRRARAGRRRHPCAVGAKAAVRGCWSTSGFSAAARRARALAPQPLIERNTAMNDKTATVHWAGRGRQGQGTITTETPALKGYPYGVASRFEGDTAGTNPEELI